MCKHIANVQTLIFTSLGSPISVPLQFAFQAPCCRRWFDCSECHFERSDHRLAAAAELAMLCRACEKPFRKDLAALGVEDETCPHCGAALVVLIRRGSSPEPSSSLLLTPPPSSTSTSRPSHTGSAIIITTTTASTINSSTPPPHK